MEAARVLDSLRSRVSFSWPSSTSDSEFSTGLKTDWVWTAVFKISFRSVDKPSLSSSSSWTSKQKFQTNMKYFSSLLRVLGSIYWCIFKCTVRTLISSKKWAVSPSIMGCNICPRLLVDGDPCKNLSLFHYVQLDIKCCVRSEFCSSHPIHKGFSSFRGVKDCKHTYRQNNPITQTAKMPKVSSTEK